MAERPTDCSLAEEPKPGAVSFTLSDSEARRIQRGAFLPALLILPMAAMFGFDNSKSQPMHFLMVLSVAVVIATIIVSISWFGAKRRIDEFSRTTLTITPNKLIWNSSLGRSELDLTDVVALSIQKVRGSVRSVTLARSAGSKTRLEGYAEMNILAKKLSDNVSCEVACTNAWLGI